MTIVPASTPITRTAPAATTAKSTGSSSRTCMLSRIQPGNVDDAIGVHRPPSATSRPRFQTRSGRNDTRSGTATMSAT